MKIDARGTEKALENVGSWRAVLLHGEDNGLIRERASHVVRKVVGSLDDPFRVAVLARDAHESLVSEVQALSLVGGRRVVWMRDAQDIVTSDVVRALEIDSDTLVVIEAQGLASKSRLRHALEPLAHVAVIACYPEEGRALSQTIRHELHHDKISLSEDAMAWLVESMGADRAAVRQEMEKLALYGRPGDCLELEDVLACCGDAGAASVEDATSAALSGEMAAMDLALERAIAEGVTAVGLIRANLYATTRLLKVADAMQQGIARPIAIKSLRPPLFFKRAYRFNLALDRWSIDEIRNALTRIQAAELACKQGSVPGLTICRNLYYHLCRIPRRGER